MSVQSRGSESTISWKASPSAIGASLPAPLRPESAEEELLEQEEVEGDDHRREDRGERRQPAPG